jgi:hypothetical protein
MKYDVEISVTKNIEASLTTRLIVDAKNGKEAEKQVKKMLDAFENPQLNSSQSSLIERLQKLCKDDIEDFERNIDTWENIDISTDILDVSPVLPV